MKAKVRLTVGSGIRQTSGMRTATGAPVGTRMVPVLKYIRTAKDWQEVHWDGERIGWVRKFGSKWQAQVPMGESFFCRSRRAAGERLRQMVEG